MPDDEALAEAVDASFVDAFRRFSDRDSGLVARFGTVEVAAMGLPVGFFNAIFVLEPLRAPDDLSAALAALRDRGLPFVVHIRGDLEESSISVAEALGLKQSAVLPGMAMPLPASAPEPPQGVRVDRVLDEASYSAAMAVGAEGFGMPLEFAKVAFPVSMLDDEAIRGYLAYALDEPVATATSIQLGSVLGIYNVATAPTRRRSGYGAAVSWRAIEEADPGTSVVVLQSSPEGLPLYERMGFRTVVEYREFEPA
jgi:GNAT superfamily N-acetyltransferase